MYRSLSSLNEKINGAYAPYDRCHECANTIKYHAMESESPKRLFPNFVNVNLRCLHNLFIVSSINNMTNPIEMQKLLDKITKSPFKASVFDEDGREVRVFNFHTTLINNKVVVSSSDLTRHNNHHNYTRMEISF